MKKAGDVVRHVPGFFAYATSKVSYFHAPRKCLVGFAINTLLLFSQFAVAVAENQPLNFELFNADVDP